MAPSQTPPTITSQVLEQILALDQLTLRQHTDYAKVTDLHLRHRAS
jgi:hypothetical protein